MARSQDPRTKLPSQRGAKRTGAIGTILPGDDAEVARDIQRLWLEISRLNKSADSIQWADTGGSAGGGAAVAIPTFALTLYSGFPDIGSTPLILDGAVDTPNFYASSAGTFDVSSAGRARILVPGMYVIGCQLALQTIAAITANTYVYLSLAYAGGVGFSIEIPSRESGFLVGTTGEDLLGTRYVWPTGAASSHDIALQRLHPISLTSAASFPLEIHPTIDTSAASGKLRIVTLALWGFRLGAPLDAAHSN